MAPFAFSWKDDDNGDKENQQWVEDTRVKIYNGMNEECNDKKERKEYRDWKW